MNHQSLVRSGRIFVHSNAYFLVVVGHYTLNDRYVNSSDLELWLEIQSIQAIPFVFGCLLARLPGFELIKSVEAYRDNFISREQLQADPPAEGYVVRGS